jgi:hypothetical protein
MPIPEVACNNRVPAFHSSGNSHCTALILYGCGCKSFVAPFAENFDTPFENVIGATIFWGLLPFESQKCPVSL